MLLGFKEYYFFFFPVGTKGSYIPFLGFYSFYFRFNTSLGEPIPHCSGSLKWFRDYLQGIVLCDLGKPLPNFHFNWTAQESRGEKKNKEERIVYEFLHICNLSISWENASSQIRVHPGATDINVSFNKASWRHGSTKTQLFQKQPVPSTH